MTPEAFFYKPRLTAQSSLAGPVSLGPPQVFQPLPPPTGAAPYRLDLAALLGDAAVKAIADRKLLVFHTVGDTGGVKSPEPQEIVSQWMEHDFDALDPPPSFFYHLGDVVYFDGERNSYYDQFYDPYLHYAAPIFGIPGNHDGDVAIPPVAPSLEGFMVNFCASTPAVQPEARDATRPAMTQPNCYWTLTTPLATIVGLYTNCPEHGVVADDQVAWFRGELTAAAADKALIIALHHPPYSADAHHGASAAMRQLLQDAFTATNRWPELVLSGHVHNYQRFSVTWDGHPLAFVVAGAGGYPNLHYMAQVDGGPPPIPWVDDATGATLDAYNVEHRHGFLRLTVTDTEIEGVYTTVPRPQESWTSGPVQQIDQFTVVRAS